MLARAPWWAYPPDEIKIQIVAKAEKVSVDELVNVTSPPPPHVTDRRGEILRWENGLRGVVVGYCHKERTEIHRSPKGMIHRATNHRHPNFAYNGNRFDARKTAQETRAIHVWWVFLDGDFSPIKWKAPSSRMWRTENEIAKGAVLKKMKGVRNESGCFTSSWGPQAPESSPSPSTCASQSQP